MTLTTKRPQLTKKHFEALATAIAKNMGGNLRKKMAHSISPVLKQLNPAFDEQRFMKACLGKYLPKDEGERRIIVKIGDAGVWETLQYQLLTQEQAIHIAVNPNVNDASRGRYYVLAKYMQ